MRISSKKHTQQTTIRFLIPLIINSRQEIFSFIETIHISLSKYDRYNSVIFYKNLYQIPKLKLKLKLYVSDQTTEKPIETKKTEKTTPTAGKSLKNRNGF